MAGQRIGYIRVSSGDQNNERQLEGLALDEVFTDEISGSSTKRPQLEAMLRYARRGDTVYVHAMERLARNLVDLRRLVVDLTSKGVTVVFHSEKLSFTGDDSPMALLMLSIMGAVAEFDLANIRARQREGIAIAKKKGVYKGRPCPLNAEQLQQLREDVARGVPKAALARKFGISRSSVYQYAAK
jgi:DNA invertase Pin-like site-specific DNA recombinase